MKGLYYLYPGSRTPPALQTVRQAAPCPSSFVRCGEPTNSLLSTATLCPAFAFEPVWTSPYLPLSPASEATNPASQTWRPRLSARGTSTLLNNALPSTHFRFCPSPRDGDPALQQIGRFPSKSREYEISGSKPSPVSNQTTRLAADGKLSRRAALFASPQVFSTNPWSAQKRYSVNAVDVARSRH